MVRVAEVERQVENLGVRLLEHRRGSRESRLGDEAIVARSVRGEMALECTDAHPDERGGLPDGRIVVAAGQRFDGLADGSHEIL